MRWWRYLVPAIAWTDLFPMFGVALCGAGLGGVYGVLHDQLTYSISPEYFTKLKFDQFHYANFGLGDRLFAGTIGFLATWWVGFIAAWFLARRCLPNQPRPRAYRQIRCGFLIVFTSGLLGGLIGFGYGLWRGPAADYSSWAWAQEELGVLDLWSFVRVAYIHNGGYLGCVLGLIAALLVLRKSPSENHPNDRQ